MIAHCDIFISQCFYLEFIMNEIEKSILLTLSTCGGKHRYIHSATVIGEVLSNYFAIGDKKIYSSILDMAKKENSPILLRSKELNENNVYELSYRYTEMKLSSFGKGILDNDIKK